MHNNTAATNARVSFTQAQGLILAILGLFVSLILAGCDGKSPHDVVKTEWAEVMAQTEVIVEHISPSGVVMADVIGQYAHVNPYSRVSNREVTDYEWHDYRKLEVVYGEPLWAVYGHSLRFIASGMPLTVGGKANLVYIKARRTLRNGEQYDQIERIEVRPVSAEVKTGWEEEKLPEQNAQKKTQALTGP